MAERHKTHAVKVGPVTVGGGAPVVIQSMTNTDTVDIIKTARQCIDLAAAGSEMVRVTVNILEAAAAVAEIKGRMRDAGCYATLIGIIHLHGDVVLTVYTVCTK